jgi:hypothetical protein
VQVTQTRPSIGETKQALYKLFAAYIHTIAPEGPIESVEQARRDAQLRYVVLYEAACCYGLGRAERLEGSHLRTFALELKEQLAQALAAFVTSIRTQPPALSTVIYLNFAFLILVVLPAPTRCF